MEKNFKLIAIAAVSVDGVIGISNEIPWKILEDFKHFRKTTIGHTLLIGYNTYLTLQPKAFEGRNYIVLWNEDLDNVPMDNENIFFVKDIAMAFELINLMKIERVYLAGGAMVYNTLIEYCDEAIITWVNRCYLNGNKFFPIDKLYNLFEEQNSTDWQTSDEGILYKVVNYMRGYDA